MGRKIMEAKINGTKNKWERKLMGRKIMGVKINGTKNNGSEN